MQFDRLKRRDFVTLLGGVAAWPVAARAQQTMPLVGVLGFGWPESSAHLVATFQKGLGETGYAEGRNVAIDFRWAQNDSARLAQLAAELVGRRVAVIAALGGTPALAVKAATATIPIAFSTAGDPIEMGLVASLNRPGGSATGLSDLGARTAAKRFGLLHELLPMAKRFAVLVNPISRITRTEITDAQAAASAVGGELDIFSAGTRGEIDAAFASLMQKRADGVLVGPYSFFLNRRAQLLTLAARHGLSTIYAFREMAEAGGLMSYGASTADQIRQLGIYAGRILKGAKPADLPVVQSSRFELVINAQIARMLGLTVPDKLLAAADEVIE